jgi:hypothetical protein
MTAPDPSLGEGRNHSQLACDAFEARGFVEALEHAEPLVDGVGGENDARSIGP